MLLPMIRRLVLLGALLALLLNAAFALHFMLDPLGLVPVLDARENMGWALRIASGQLPVEPFFRALFYPAILALFAQVNLLSPAVVTVFGLVCHLFNGFLTGLLARRVWGSYAAAWFSGLLYAVYPVAMWFAVQTLDISLGITLFLLGIYLLLRGCDEKRRRSQQYRDLFFTGMLGGLAVLARPNFLTAVLLLPLLPSVLIYNRSGEVFKARVREGALALLLVGSGLLFMLLAQGFMNQHVSGEFRVLPWQGPYNLYAGNHSGANGKYLVQHVSFADLPAGVNPARMESEYLYRQAVGPEAELDIDAMNAYWRQALVEEIQEQPVRWLGLMGRKLVYLFNDWEQYNNLSYEYHKERFALLRYNPLGWCVLLIGGLAGLLVGWSRLDRSRGLVVVLLVLGYAGGLLLFFVSARFRLPLASLMCVFSGGLVFCTVSRLRMLGLLRVGLVCCLGALLAVVGYGNWFNAKDRAPYIQDEALLATASLQAGRDDLALEYADAVLARDGTRSGARRTQVSALFNLWLMAADAERAEAFWLRLVSALEELSQPDASAYFIQGVVEWRGQEAARAKASWHAGLARFGEEASSCAKALQAIGAEVFFEPDEPGVATVRQILMR
jgi:hypothetical protein